MRYNTNLNMKLFRQHLTFFTILYLVLFPQRAHAYLDPGTGSYVLQIAAALLFGSLFLIKTWWHQIKHMVLRIFGRKDKLSEKHSKKDE